MARRTLMARDAKMAKELATGLNTLEKRRAKTYHKKTYPVLVVNSCKFEGIVYMGIAHILLRRYREK